MIALYDGEIAYVDAELGRVFDSLQRAGIDERTAIAITADHGELLFDDPERRIAGHGRHRFDPVLRVPLVMRLPGAEAGSRVPGMVGLIDLAPTLLELAGVTPPAAMEGHSLVPLMNGNDEPTREVSFSSTLHSDGVARLAARTVDAKLICDKGPDAMRCAMFDLTADPAEQANVADAPGFRDRREALTGELERWYREGMASGALHALGNRSEKARKLLERAGYLREGAD